MNFREQLSEAYRAGFNQGLEDLQEKQSPAGSKPTKNPGKRPSFRPQDTPRKPYDEDMHEKALAELGRMVMDSMHEGMHEGEYEEQFGADPEPIDVTNRRKALRRLYGKHIGKLIGDATLGTYSPLYGLMKPGQDYSGIQTPFG